MEKEFRSDVETAFLLSAFKGSQGTLALLGAMIKDLGVFTRNQEAELDDILVQYDDILNDLGCLFKI